MDQAKIIKCNNLNPLFKQTAVYYFARAVVSPEDWMMNSINNAGHSLKH